jgi:serine/threonine protein kinase
MVVCVTGFFPWEAARLSDERFCAWATAWTKANEYVQRGEATVAERNTLLTQLLVRLTVGTAPSSSSLNAASPSMQLLELMVHMLNPSPEQRVSMADVVAHAWFASRDSDCGESTGVSGGSIPACVPTDRAHAHATHSSSSTIMHTSSTSCDGSMTPVSPLLGSRSGSDGDSGLEEISLL